MRIDLNEIVNWIAPNSRILDLACGNGPGRTANRW
ncbi:MAG: methionine biosynthesis protein MetW [Exilibacterium sp.]